MVTRVLGGAAGRLLGGVMRQRLARVSFFSLALKAIGTLLVFALSVTLARALGPTHYGTYEYVIAWVTLLLVPAVFGLDKLAVRELSAAVAREDWEQAKGFLRWSLTMVLALALGVAATAAAVAFLSAGGRLDTSLLAFLLGCVVVPLSALTILWESTVRGLHGVIEGQLPTLVARPLLVITLVLVGLGVLGLPATAVTALGAFLIGAVGALLLAFALLLRQVPQSVRHARSSPRGRAWFAAALPMAVMAALYTANGRIGTILLGGLVGPESAGIYALATRGADLVMLALVAVNTALSPTFAALVASAEAERLQRVVTQGTRLIFALGFPLALGLFVFAELFLSIFGPEYVVGAGALRLLLVGQVVNVAMGSVGTLLVMANRERLATLGFASGTAANLVLAALLIPPFGVIGAALAATVSMIVWNGVLWSFTLRSVGVHPTVLGAPRGR
jgi:O-antigen/teichoic acid export membrane protein